MHISHLSWSIEEHSSTERSSSRSPDERQQELEQGMDHSRDLSSGTLNRGNAKSSPPTARCNPRRVASYFAVVGIGHEQAPPLPPATGSPASPAAAAATAVAEGPKFFSEEDNGASVEELEALRTEWESCIVDVGVLFPDMGEVAPTGWEPLWKTPGGRSANCNEGVTRTDAFLAVRRRTRSSTYTNRYVVDVVIVHPSSATGGGVPPGFVLLKKSLGGARRANLNSGGRKEVMLAVKYADGLSPALPAGVSDVVVLKSTEHTPHGFERLGDNLNEVIHHLTHLELHRLHSHMVSSCCLLLGCLERSSCTHCYQAYTSVCRRECSPFWHDHHRSISGR